jgi:hypothetical protein
MGCCEAKIKGILEYHSPECPYSEVPKNTNSSPLEEELNNYTSKARIMGGRY